MYGAVIFRGEGYVGGIAGPSLLGWKDQFSDKRQVSLGPPTPGVNCGIGQVGPN